MSLKLNRPHVSICCITTSLRGYCCTKKNAHSDNWTTILINTMQHYNTKTVVVPRVARWPAWWWPTRRYGKGSRSSANQPDARTVSAQNAKAPSRPFLGRLRAKRLITPSAICMARYGTFSSEGSEAGSCGESNDKDTTSKTKLEYTVQSIY